MSTDGAVEAVFNNNDGGKNSDNVTVKRSSHLPKRFSESHSLNIVSEEKSRTHNTSDNNEVDYSFGANLRNQQYFQTRTPAYDCKDNGNMDIQTPEPPGQECAADSVNFTSVESFAPSSEGKDHSSLKECDGLKLPSEKKQPSVNSVIGCESVNLSVSLKSAKSVKSYTSGCRSTIQDPHESCLRMDALPNVSPDSGIISIEGSPFGNESPHSGIGGEIRQETNLLPIVGKSKKIDEEVNDTKHVDIAFKEQLSPTATPHKGDVYSDETKDINSIHLEMKHSDSIISDEHFDPSHRDIIVLDTRSCLENEEKEKTEEIVSRIDDFTPSSSEKISLNKDEKGESVNNQTLNGNLRLHQASDVIGGVKILEARLRKSKEALDSLNTRHSNISSAEALGKDSFAKKKSVGRPRGSLNKKFGYDPPRRTYRKAVPKSTDEYSETLKPVQPSSLKDGEKIKRSRGRPRKYCSTTNEEPSPSKVLKGKKKKTRKRVFTRVRKTNLNKMVPKQSCKEDDSNENLMEVAHKEASKSIEFMGQHSPLNSFLKSDFDLGSKNSFVTKTDAEISKVQHMREITSEKSDFSSKDLEVILKSVKSSISSQFTPEKDDEIDSSLHFDNPFKFAKSPSFPQLAHPAEKLPVRPKPKYKKPKLHVMMRKTKRRKKKKFESSRLGGFGASSPQRRLSFFTSRMQPSKILASSRLNVFQTGTGAGVETSRPETPTDGEQTEGSEKRIKKRRKLLSFKSKHKNITDPALAADLSVIEGSLRKMAISENAADNFIKVRPGEMPLPSIFRVKKIDVMKKVKEKMMSEFSNFETAKVVKSVRKEIALPVVSSSSVKNMTKSQRKKNSPEESFCFKDQTSLSDSSDQWLPPKKRHRMVHGDSMISQSMPRECLTLGNTTKESCHGDGKRKGRRQRKTEGDGSVSNFVSHPNLDQVLTIDTSSYSTAGSSVSTLTPSPCPSRQSTRSSTFTSISSLSPAECNFVHGRHISKIGGSLACPNHSFQNASFQNDFMSCAECQLLRRSTATTRTSNTIRSNSPFIQSSNQSFGFSSAFDNQTSSSECSPVLKTSSVTRELNRRYPLKRTKLSNAANKEIELSLPKLEKHNLLTSSTFPPELCAAPTEIFSEKRNTPSHGRAALKRSVNSTRPSLSYAVNEAVERSSHQIPEQPSPSSAVSDILLCNTPVNLSHLSASSSVIPILSDSDRQPLPLEHCKKKDVVEKIQTALQFESSDNSSSDEEKDGHQYPSNSNHKATSSGQPPRKRFQRVGLFSDFYKDNEPRKRCENMVRCREKLVYVKDEHEYGLMPLPIHVGFHYMTQIQDFQLPYDVWWQDCHNQLPKKSEAKSKFRTIRSNIYVDGKANCRKKEIPACSCKPSNGGVGCLDDCLNRMIYTECSMLNCPLGEHCGNQRIQKHEWAPGIEKFLTEDRGIGVRVTKPVKSGQFILEYLGEVISETEFRRRMMEEYSEECHHYALHLDSGNVIDGYRMGNIGRYVNHSCQPNCEMQKWNVNGLYRMVLVAQRDIGAFEELGYDYNFDAFNQQTQQECRCGNPECRGVIGGKGQRNNGASKHEKTDDTKDKRKSKLLNKKNRDGKCVVENIPVLPPMTNKERWFARKHSIFLVRNVDKVLNQRHPGQLFSPMTKEEMYVGKINCVTSDVLLSNLTESSVKTRLASFAKDNPEILRRHQLAQLFDKVLTELLSLKDQEGNSMVMPLMSLPSRKKQPQYYQVVKEPIDLSVIKQRVKTGHYSHLKPFNADLMLLFKNVELYCGPRSDIGQVVIKLRHILLCAMQELSAQIDELLGPGATKLCMDMNLDIMDERGAKDKQEPEEDIIRCICGVTRDEGLMLQCEKCMRWQHCDCVGASGKEEHYLCDRCEPRYYDPEILLAPPLPDSLPDCTHFMTLVKDDVQYAIGDCVYVMRDCKRSASGTPLRSSHRLIATSNPDSLDIFRVEQLWKDPKGERFASGTPYLRPQETFHEPTRKFLHNELFRTPNYEIIPLDLVMGKCVVMDPTTYCKGRPKGIKEQDVYVCEYRVDKTAHLFHKIKEIWYPINTNRFCFDYFETKLSLKRTFTPHEIPEEYRRKAIRNSNSAKCGKVTKALPVKDEKPDVKNSKSNHPVINSKVKIDDSLKHDIKLKAEVKVNMNKGSDLNQDVKSEACSEKSNVRKQFIEEKLQEKRHRLDRFCLKLLNSMPGKQKVDLSYLLDGGKRIRKKLMK